ncbi:kirola-like [Andrographis paniculata]|uniref:kirola-like n=1 Tax=Andrographis paniculata TaxID=175694 RepID=UPI0021E87551|nr:kirola-like [Andrographis paniculata]
MGLTGKLIAAIEFKHGGDVFHDLFKQRPHEIANASPLVHGFELHQGELGKAGSVVSWHYTHDGKRKIAKQIIQKIDEETKSMEFKMIEGDLMEDFKDFLIVFHIETKNNIDLVTWTLDYEMLHEDVVHPTTLLAYFIEVTKDIEAHHDNKP